MPLTEIDSVRGLKARLTFTPLAFGDEVAEPMHLYDASRAGFLGVPREFGLAEYRHLTIDDKTTLGGALRSVSRRPSPHHVRVRNPAAQAAFMAGLRQGFATHRSFIASAATGSGKTVCALDTAAHLGRRTLILVHLQRLMDQWIDEIQDKLGVPPERIGVIQQDRCEWQHKDFCVGLLHSVVRRKYPANFYTAFGLVIYDEVHKVGSQFFTPAVSLFPSRYRLGLSATVKRKDGGDKAFIWHLGPIRVTSDAEALPMTVYVVPFATRQPLWGTSHGARVKCLSHDVDRNALIVSFIRRFYQTGRQALVVGESVGHLQRLMLAAERAGVPRAAMGQFTSEIHRKVLDPQTGRAKTTKVKQNKGSLDKIKQNAQIVFATYGMMTEGIDIPRLDAGIDATPRSAATQLIGRIRRPVPGKRTPIWITLRDTRCTTSVRYFRSRMRDYQSTNAEVVNYGTSQENSNRGRDRGSQTTLVGPGAQCASPRPLPAGRAVPREGHPAGAGGVSSQPIKRRLDGARRRLPQEPVVTASNRAGA